MLTLVVQARRNYGYFKRLAEITICFIVYQMGPNNVTNYAEVQFFLWNSKPLGPFNEHNGYTTCFLMPFGTPKLELEQYLQISQSHATSSMSSLRSQVVGMSSGLKVPLCIMAGMLLVMM
jgi:hypothetical protein